MGDMTADAEKRSVAELTCCLSLTTSYGCAGARHAGCRVNAEMDWRMAGCWTIVGSTWYTKVLHCVLSQLMY
jgi:hypothetical protein